MKKNFVLSTDLEIFFVVQATKQNFLDFHWTWGPIMKQNYAQDFSVGNQASMQNFVDSLSLMISVDEQCFQIRIEIQWQSLVCHLLKTLRWKSLR